MARAKKMIRAERDKEILFEKLCAQIRLDDYREQRSEEQRDERRSKRKRAS